MAPKWPSTLQGQRDPIFLLLVSTSPKFHPFRSNTSWCCVKAILRKMHQMTPNDLKPYKDKVLHICFTRINESQISLYFAIRWAISELQAIFEKSAPNDPKWSWTCVTCVHVSTCVHVLLASLIPKFHSVLLSSQPLLRYMACWDKRTEWAQIDLEPCKVKLPYIWIASIPDSQIPLRFALWPAIFEIQVILRQIHRMTPKGLWTLQGHTRSYVPQIYIFYHYQRVPSFTPFHSTTRDFWNTGHFEKRSELWPQIDLEPYKVKLPYIGIRGVPESQISLRFALRPAVFESHAILRQMHQMTPNDLEHYKVKGTPHICSYCPRVSNFTPFCSTTSPFQDIAHFIILIIPHWLPC